MNAEIRARRESRKVPTLPGAKPNKNWDTEEERLVAVALLKTIKEQQTK